uniref:Uncharacterized protein n=1 Tax=Marinobacter nauticus TaxID=2743 RepID=A0A455WFN9_MARNT|nr:hypothetical protein YBY_25010 [Marinobacter nauticus]
MHHVLAHARLVVTDSQTMTAEAACLGVSVVRVSTFVGKLSYLDDLERVGLAHSCLPDDLERLELLLSDISKENRVSKKSEERRLFALRRYGNFNLDLLDIVGEQ